MRTMWFLGLRSSSRDLYQPLSEMLDSQVPYPRPRSARRSRWRRRLRRRRCRCRRPPARYPPMPCGLLRSRRWPASDGGGVLGDWRFPPFRQCPSRMAQTPLHRTAGTGCVPRRSPRTRAERLLGRGWARGLPPPGAVGPVLVRVVTDEEAFRRQCCNDMKNTWTPPASTVRSVNRWSLSYIHVTHLARGARAWCHIGSRVHRRVAVDVHLNAHSRTPNARAHALPQPPLLPPSPAPRTQGTPRPFMSRASVEVWISMRVHADRGICRAHAEPPWMIRRIWTRTGCTLHGPRARYDSSVTMVMLS